MADFETGENLMSKINTAEIAHLRTMSENAWEQAADEPRDEGSAKEFMDNWDAWGESWDAAEELIDGGDIAGAKAALEVCRLREADYGDDSFARRAIALL